MLKDKERISTVESEGDLSYETKTSERLTPPWIKGKSLIYTGCCIVERNIENSMQF